jgi:hypothetical protein
VAARPLAIADRAATIRMIGEELARCHVGAMLREQPGRYYCARCLAGLLDGAVSTKREARRAIAVLFRWPIGLTTTLRRGRQPCRGCGLVGGARLGAGAVRLGYSP